MNELPKTSLAIRDFLDEFGMGSGKYWPVDSPLATLRRLCYQLLDERDKLRADLQNARRIIDDG